MKYLYPAQKLNTFSLIKYSALSLIGLFSFLFSFSQKTTLTNTSVDLVSFTAQSNGADKIDLNIVTGSEINFSHFVIQRSADGVNFEDVAIIFSEEDNTNSAPRFYFYTNNLNKKSASIYYRLKIVDLKEQYKYSDTIAFSSLTSGIYANVSPQQNKLKITIPENWSGKTVYYSIYNANNKIIKEEVRNNATQTETLNITDLPTGRYIIKAVNGKDSSEQKIVKLNSYS
jgi:Secretion system C-terminal sorting domain